MAQLRPCVATSGSLERVQELKTRGLVSKDDSVLVVQSGSSSAWGFRCNHAVMLWTVP